MRLTNCLLIFSLFSLICQACIAQEWGCYDPKPDHPTATERADYISEISPLVIAAETNHGVPAGAMAAMAIIESGYGWTRTSINANNVFGWKFVSKNSSGGRNYYTLECQPKEDVNNKYIIFKDRKEAIDFVANKLENLPAYRIDTATYRAKRVQGSDIILAIKDWVAGISDPYNWKPAEYTKNIIRIMNNPLSPSDNISPENNLYKLSANKIASNHTDATSALSNNEITYAENKIKPWKSSHCADPINNYPRWEGFPVTLCEYSDVGVTVKTYMLNADRNKLAHWVVTACLDAKAPNMHSCIDYLVKTISTASSGGIFPIAGYIPEPQNGGVCYVFRDGVTVWTKLREYWLKPKNNACGSSYEEEMTQPLSKAWKYGRIASTTRQEYKIAGGELPVDGLKWVDVVRNLYQKAWNSDRNELISATAIQAKKDNAF